jgi:8-oxo-dGTP pyrophosphatase MutT (NUDIX family)
VTHHPAPGVADAAGTTPGDLVRLVGERLSGRVARERPLTGGLRHAAVAVALLQRAGRVHVLLVKRVPRGRNPGQWALPGGRVDAGESSRQAAVRELAEETGVTCRAGDVLGRLDDVVTGSGHVMAPWVVAPTGSTPARRNPAEVASLHPIPVDRLLAPGVPRWKPTADGPLLQLPLRHDMVVHAPTGAILWQFAEVALRGRDLRIDDVLEPAFVRR